MRSIRIVVSVLLVVSACSRPPGRTAPSSLAGTFDLVEINGQRLPIKRGPITDRAGRRTNCDSVLDQGRLSLDPERQRYELHYLIRSSCDGRILTDTGSLGSYTRVDSTLAFQIPSIDQPSEFRGSVNARAITVQFYDQRMVFALRGSASALPLSGYFGTGDPVVLSRYPGTRDSVVLLVGPSQHYETRFAPATGYFAVGREAVDVSGPYEQIGRVIYVEGNAAPGPIRVLRALIVSKTEIDVLRAGAAPQRFSKLDLPWPPPEPAQSAQPGLAEAKPNAQEALPPAYSLTDETEWANLLDEGERAVLRRGGVPIDTVDLAFGVRVVGRDSLVFLPVRSDSSCVEGSDPPFPCEDVATEHVLWTPSGRRELRQWLPHFYARSSSPTIGSDSLLYYWSIARHDSTFRLSAIRYDFRTQRLDSLFLRYDTMATDYRYHLWTPRLTADEVIFGNVVISKRTWQIVRHEPPSN